MPKPRLLALLLPLLLGTTVLAGCLEPGEGIGSSSLSEFLGASGDERMTARESQEESSGINAGVPPTFYAERKVTVEGEVALAHLPVTLGTVNGAIDVVAGEEGVYALVVTMRGYGLTEDRAREALDTMRLRWAHEAGGRHFLEAVVEMEDAGVAGLVDVGRQRTASIALSLPPSLLVSLDADTTNGGVTVSGLLAEDLALDTTNGGVSVQGVTARRVEASTTNGNVDVDAMGTEEVSLDTTNGNIAAGIMPGASGAIRASTTNGNVAIEVPEGPRFGYLAELSTTNGRASVELRDGRARSESDEDAGFETDGYSARPVRTEVHVSTTNGNASLRPA